MQAMNQDDRTKASGAVRSPAGFSCRRRSNAVDRINFALVLVSILLGSAYVLHALWTAGAFA